MNAIPPLSLAEQVHAGLVEALRRRRAAEHDAAVLLARLDAERLYLALGHVSTVAYAVGALELTVRQARALLQLGRSLPNLPALDAAFADGRLPYTKARELLRVVTPETEAAWVERATEVDSRTLEKLVSGATIGDEPPPPGEPPKGPARVRLVFVVEAHGAEVIRDALAVERAQSGVRADEVSDGALLVTILQRALHQASEEGVVTAERYRVVVEHCPTCHRTEGVDHEVSDTIASEACCDAEIVDMRPGPDQGRLTRAIPPKLRRIVLHRDRYACAVPGCRCRLWLDVHHVVPFARGGQHTERNLVTLCPAHHRLVHEGILGIGWEEGELVVRDARSVRVTHVGRAEVERSAGGGGDPPGPPSSPRGAEPPARA